MNTTRYWAMVPAAGAGKRMGLPIPKQYLPLAGRPVILHTLDTLLRKRIPIAGRQKADLIYFLHTLSDTSMTKNPRFSGELKNFIH